jgi:hypothetical protein
MLLLLRALLLSLLQVLYEYIDGEDDSSNGNDNEDNNITAAAADDSATESVATPDGPAQGSDEGDGTSQGLGLNGLGLGLGGRDSGGLGFEDSSSSSRVQLAAFQRKAELSKWLQRKLKPAVTAAIQKVTSNKNDNTPGQQQQDSLLWAVLHLMSGRQVAAAVALAVAVGDSRLATLLAAAGQAAAGVGGGNIVQQVQVRWFNCRLDVSCRVLLGLQRG